MRFVIALVIALVACGGGHPAARPITSTIERDASPPPPPPPQPAPLVIGIALVVTPTDAEVSIDDVARGPAHTLAKPIELEPGLHQLIVTRDGYKPYRAEFTVSDKTEKFTIHLER